MGNPQPYHANDKESIEEYLKITLQTNVNLTTIILLLFVIIFLGISLYLQYQSFWGGIFYSAGIAIVIAIIINIMYQFVIQRNNDHNLITSIDTSFNEKLEEVEGSIEEKFSQVKDSLIYEIDKHFDQKIDEEMMNFRILHNEIVEQLKKKLDEELVQARKFGLSRIENKLPIENLFGDLKPGDTLWWLDTFCPGHNAWIHNVKEALLRGASINMLILNPESDFCRLRAEEVLGNPTHTTVESYQDELRKFLRNFCELKKQFDEKTNLDYSGHVGRLDIVTYDDLLGVPCYVVTKDNVPIYAYSSMYLAHSTGVDFPHLFWSHGDMLKNLYIYVKNKYEKAKLKKENLSLQANA
jgi:hypothetical protein